MDIEELRPMPILTLHMPGAIAVNFSDADQRLILRCGCGVAWHHRDADILRERWAHHAMDIIDRAGFSQGRPK